MFGSQRADASNWTSWEWQIAAAARTPADLAAHFPGLSARTQAQIAQNAAAVRFQISPYLLSLVETVKGNPVTGDPIWQVYVPTYPSLMRPVRVNWEEPRDMVNPILQHKYTNRVNFRIQNRCLSYCNYCFEAMRVLDRAGHIPGLTESYFEQSIRYIQTHPEVEEAVFSGGEPLLLATEHLATYLRRVRSETSVRLLRIQTRAFAQNPFRITEDLVDALAEHDVAAIGVHVMHPRELTPEFIDAVRATRRPGYAPLLLAQIPLLRGINDDLLTLRELLLRLYSLGIKPYYLLHAMPDTFPAANYRTTVREGVELMLKLKRHVSNPALPEYIIVHRTGKHTVPLELTDTAEFRYEPGLITFRNWRGEWCGYEDAPSA